MNDSQTDFLFESWPNSSPPKLFPGSPPPAPVNDIQTMGEPKPGGKGNDLLHVHNNLHVAPPAGGDRDVVGHVVMEDLAFVHRGILRLEAQVSLMNRTQQDIKSLVEFYTNTIRVRKESDKERRKKRQQEKLAAARSK